MNAEISLNELLSIFLKRIWFIVFFTIISAVLGFLISNYVIPPQYISSTTLYVQGNDKQGSNDKQSLTDLQYRERIINTYVVILSSDDFLSMVTDQIGLDYTPTKIKQMTTIKGIPNTEVFEIKVKNADPIHAQIIAQKIAELAPEEISRVVNSGKVEVISTAKIPTKPASPNIPKNTAISLMLGFVLSLLLAYLLSLFDATVKASEELTKRYNLPVLGTIPDFDVKSRGAK